MHQFQYFCIGTNNRNCAFFFIKIWTNLYKKKSSTLLKHFMSKSEPSVLASPSEAITRYIYHTKPTGLESSSISSFLMSNPLHDFLEIHNQIHHFIRNYSVVGPQYHPAKNGKPTHNNYRPNLNMNYL